MRAKCSLKISVVVVVKLCFPEFFWAVKNGPYVDIVMGSGTRKPETQGTNLTFLVTEPDPNPTFATRTYQ